MLLPTLPVKLEPNTAESLRLVSEIRGLAFIDDDSLCLEYTVETVASALLGKMGGGGRVHNVRLPLHQLSQVEYKNYYVSALLRVLPARLSVLKDMHGVQENRLSLTIKRRDRDLAKQYASHINLRIAELRLEQLDQASDKDFLPPRGDDTLPGREDPQLPEH